jgi:UDP-N-acetylmuramate dehydrogenase
MHKLYLRPAIQPNHLGSGSLLHDEPLAPYTSWHVGGAARQLYRPRGLADLAAFLRRLPTSEPLFWLGLGSNLLVRDGGVPGTVIVTHGALDELKVTGITSLRVEAGVACARVARQSARMQLRGVEFLAGIPGTLGGALAMNAGAFGSEIWTYVDGVETLDRYGQQRLRRPEDFEIGYRHVRGVRGEWFVAACLRLERDEKAQGHERIRELLSRRARSQPTGERSCGSVFRNPPGDSAGRLIEACGLKGVCVGGACVSTKHANFIVNTGSATAADIEQLMKTIVEKVAQQWGIRLEPEVRIIGEPRDEQGLGSAWGARE